MAAMVETSVDVEKVKAILGNFKFSEALVQEESVEEIKCQLKGLSTLTVETKVTIQSEMDAARQQLREAEAALEQVQESERQGVAELETSVNTLVEAQVQMQAVADEKEKLQREHHDEILVSEELREAKSKNISINEGAFCSLLNGSWTSEKDQKEKLAAVKEYLKEIGTEQTLVAAAGGLLAKPEERGDFDKMAIDCITEELIAELKKVEEKLSERAPADREVQAELLGLEALGDICQQKATAAEEEHKKVEAVVKGFKTEVKKCKQQIMKSSKAIDGFTAKIEAEDTKAKNLEEAFAAVDRLVEAAKAAVQKAAAEKAAEEEAAAMEKAAAEKEAAEKEAAEKEAAEKEAAEKEAAEKEAAEKAAEKVDAERAVETAETEKDLEHLEPPAKRMRTEDANEAKEAKLEAQVASPARVRLSIG